MVDEPRSTATPPEPRNRSGKPIAPLTGASQAPDPLRDLLADEAAALLLLRRAIADPGQFLRRDGWGTADAESITSWSARAVLAALREVAGL